VAELSAYGITVDVPQTWEGRIFARPEAGQVSANAFGGAPAPPGERVNPLVHLATLPMPTDVGDFGSGVVEQLTAEDVFIVLKEFDPSSATTPLFRRSGMPLPLDPEAFSPDSLQRVIPGQAGFQIFYNELGGAYCLYVVLGSFARRVNLASTASDVLETVTVTPR
jgi:hypothetical protein